MTLYSKRKKCILFTILSFAMMMFVCFYYVNTLAYSEKQGTVNGTNVNIRTSAGTNGNSNRLTYNGSYVQLNVGNTVKVVGEENASDGSLWYKITFVYTNNVTLSGYIHSAYVTVSDVEYDDDGDFEKYLDAQGFPESYKNSLRQLHALYPKWVFIADKISYNWNEVVQNESLIGRSLVSKNSISSWKSLEPGCYDWETASYITYDGGSWVNASKELISYYLDPRNFLDEVSIFQFESQSYNSSVQKLSNVESMLADTYMNKLNVETGRSFAQTFMDAAQQSGVSPYHLVSRALQEIGKSSPSGSASGLYTSPATGITYTGLFNFYNIGAYAHDGKTPIENGLIYASKTDATYLRPWDAKYKAIIGGAKYLGSTYINIGQDTAYYQKFDFIGQPYTHQYMTNIQAPSSESVKLSKAYTANQKSSLALVFKIPVYQGMTSSKCPCPTGDGSPNNVLKELKVDGYILSPTFTMFTTSYDLIVANNVSSVNISATKYDSTANISGVGKVNLNVGNNVVKVNVTAQSGAVRTYIINIVRKNGDTPVTPETEAPQETTTSPGGNVDETSYSTSMNILNDTYLTGISPGTSANSIKATFSLKNCSVKTYKMDGVTETGDTVGSGTQVKIISNSTGQVLKQYVCLIYGDVNGDSKIDIFDMLYQKRDILDITKLSGFKIIAADINNNNKIDIFDMLYIKRDILGISQIKQ